VDKLTPGRARIVANDVARRSRTGVFAYTGLSCAVALGSSFSHTHLVAASSVCAGTFAIALPRLWLSLAYRPEAEQRPVAWMAMFRVAAVIAAAYWGIAAAVALRVGSNDDSLIVLASTAGIAAGAATSLSADKWLVVAYLASLLGPMAASELAEGSIHDAAFAATMVFFFGFLVRQAATMRHSLFESCATAALLEARASALDAAHTKAREAEAAANAANRAKTIFLANVSHEIRTPMATIVGYSEMMMGGELAEEEKLPCLRIVHQSSERLLALLNDVLDLAKIEGGNLAVRPGRCDLPVLLRQFEIVARRLAGEHHVDLELSLATPIPSLVESDGARLTQVLVNLVGEAITAAESQRVRVEVGWVSQVSKPLEPFLKVEIIDGSGRQAVAVARPAFEPFSKVDAWTTRGATSEGLRLAIAQGVARLLGGDLRRGDESARSTFTLELPVKVLSSGICTDLHPSSPNTPAARALEGARVLLVQSGAESDAPLAATLNDAGAIVEVVKEEDAAVVEALRAERRHAPFDVVLLDAKRPSLDGHAGVARLRASGYRRGVVALGRSAMSGDRERSLESGYDEHIARPIDCEGLIETLGVHPQWTAEAAGTATGKPLEPVISAMADDPIIASLLDRFFEDVAAREHALRRALERGDGAAMKRVAHSLAGVGGSYGFDSLSDTARSLESSTEGPCRVEDLRPQVEALSLLCQRILAGARAKRGGAAPPAALLGEPHPA
jgi:signal transduction histidine kinase/CheY-like chemotaxis protein